MTIKAILFKDLQGLFSNTFRLGRNPRDRQAQDHPDSIKKHARSFCPMNFHPYWSPGNNRIPLPVVSSDLASPGHPPLDRCSLTPMVPA